MILRMNPIRIQNYIALAVVIVLVGVVFLVANSVQSGKSETQVDASVIAKKTLFFRDLPDGSVGVISASDGKMIAQVEGQAGFVRGILRALARERRIQEITSDNAFELMSRSDGRLTLVDLATGNRIDLESFGRDNAAQFAAFLNGAGQ